MYRERDTEREREERDIRCDPVMSIPALSRPPDLRVGRSL